MQPDECCDETDCSCPCLKIKEYVGASYPYKYTCAECGHTITHKLALKEAGLTESEIAVYLNNK